MTDFDKMTDEELDAYLASHDAPRKAAPGAGEYGWVLIVAGVAGALASLQLLLSQLELEADPYANLSCDVNEILACSTFLTSWEGSLLGFSNSYLGIVGFLAMVGMGIYILVRRTLPQVIWAAMAVAAGVGLLALLWFQYTSFISAGTLCPWCLLIWAALIPFIPQTAGQAHANLADRPSPIWRHRWLIIAIWFLAVAAFAFVYFFDTWTFIFGWD